MYFLEKLLQNITQWGGTSLLVEYEDTFPYTEHFEVARGKFTYTEEFIKKINGEAAKNNIEIIPYVSLFEDLDFLLKHSEFKKYRDNVKYTEMVNPLQDDTVTVLTELVRNIMRLHPNSKSVHIGCRKPMMLVMGF